MTEAESSHYLKFKVLEIDPFGKSLCEFLGPPGAGRRRVRSDRCNAFGT
jgi:hypothetical protein